MTLFLLFASAFLAGSIPFGMIVARIRGVDLKKIGSGNIGATNVLRAMGKGPAFFTLAGDVAKGVVPVIAAGFVTGDPLLRGIAGICAILGHDFSLFLRFRGGKGVATSIGVLLAYSPPVALVTATIWLVTIVSTRYSSLGAIISFGLLPVIVLLLDSTGGKLVISAVITLLLMLRHIDNIKRLLRGSEPRIGMRA
ncbi:MAG: glycerol-3-phosphate 1-O-acyltransferase PlsY [Nitrospirae bacterium]|nr:glycerol-3-phosphate 1-O-acyltransferase PlsY [Nitrospirota bacterium]